MRQRNKEYRLCTGQDVPMKVVSSRLPFTYIRLAKKLGNGSYSKGIIVALEMAHDTLKDQKC